MKTAGYRKKNSKNNEKDEIELKMYNATGLTVTCEFAFSLVLGGNLKTVTGLPEMFCWIIKPPISSS